MILIYHEGKLRAVVPEETHPDDPSGALQTLASLIGVADMGDTSLSMRDGFIGQAIVKFSVPVNVLDLLKELGEEERRLDTFPSLCDDDDADPTLPDRPPVMEETASTTQEALMDDISCEFAPI